MKKYLFFFVTLSLLSNIIYSQIRIKEIFSTLPKQLPNYSDTETRKIISFNENWILYPEDSNEKNVKINVPALFTSDETIVYQKSFELSTNMIETNNFKIHFLGISYTADIYLNDVVIYKKPGGNIPFSVLLPNDLLNANKENKLTVKVTNELDSESTIPFYQRFLFPKNSGGIVRDVFLEVIPKENIEIVRCTPSLDKLLKEGELRLDLIINTEENDVKHSINLSILDKDGISVANTTLNNNLSSNEVKLKLKVTNPKLWSPKEPNKYIAEIRLTRNDSLIDIQRRTILFASFENRPEELFLNNKKFKIEGVTYIHSSKDSGMLTSYSDIRKDLEIIKSLGINTVRFAKATPHPFALDICAELGLLAFIEIPINSIPERFIDDANFTNRFKRFTEEFSKEYAKYPALFAIGVGGGYLSNSQTHTNFIDSFADIVKSKSHKLSFASFVGIPSREIKNLDLYGVELFGATTSLENYLLITSINRNKIFISEATYPTYLGNTNGYLNNFSFESQAKFFDETINLSRSKKIAGFFLNSMFDYYGDFSSLFTEYSSENKYEIGIIGEERNINRISYNLVKSKLTTNKRVTIPLGNRTDDAPIFFILAGLLLSIMMGLVINSNRKFREDATRALLRPYNFFADIRDHRIISGLPTIILMIILSGAHALLLSNLLFFFRSNITLEKILLAFGMPSLLASINYFAWHPYESFFFFMIFSVALFLIVSVVILLFSFFLRTKIYFRNIFYTVIWAVLPLSILLPVKMVLYRILVADVINLYIYIFLLVYFLWIIQRVIKGVYVIFDISFGRTYFYTILLLLITIGVTLLYFQLNYSTIDFIINSINQAQLI
jgi:beta-galactosidase